MEALACALKVVVFAGRRGSKLREDRRVPEWSYESTMRTDRTQACPHRCWRSSGSACICGCQKAPAMRN